MTLEAADLIEPAIRGARATLMWLADGDVDKIPEHVDSQLREDLTAFVTDNAADCLAYVAERRDEAVAEYDGQTKDDWAAECIGHDFILTRNRHGAGFWDRGLGDLGDRLTDASEPYGDMDLQG